MDTENDEMKIPVRVRGTVGKPKTEVVPVSKLIPADYNPRMITDKAREGLKKSLSKFGYLQNVIWNKRTGNIVGGHQRFDAFMELYPETKEMEVTVVDLTLEDEKALNVTLNNKHISGEFTEDIDHILLELRDSGYEDFEDLGLETLGEDMEVFKGELPPDEDFDDVTPGGGEKGEGGEGQGSVKSFDIVVRCEDEHQQRKLFKKLTDEGLNCTVL